MDNHILLKHTGIITALVLFLSATSYGQEWTFSFEPYLLAANIEGDTGIGGVDDVQVDVDTETILENLELSAMVHFEGHHESGWGFALDYGFMDLAADISSSRDGVADFNVRQGVLEALLVNRRTTDNGYLDFTAGMRWWDNDLDAVIDPAILPGMVEAEVEADWIDLVIGVRSYRQMTDNWAFLVRADIGGFGLEADFTGALAAGFQYRINDDWLIDLQYKATWVDYEHGSEGDPDYFAYDTVTHGPMLGVIFEF